MDGMRISLVLTCVFRRAILYRVPSKVNRPIQAFTCLSVLARLLSVSETQ